MKIKKIKTLFICFLMSNLVFAGLGLAKTPKTNSAADLYQKGRDLVNTDCKEALSYLEKAIENGFNNVDVYFQSGYCYGKLYRFDEEIKSLKKVIEIKPDYAEAYSNLGAAYIELGFYGDGMEASNKAIEIKPDSAEAYNNIGKILFDLGRHREAIKTFKQAIGIKTDLVEAHFGLGISFLALNDLYSALGEYKIIKKLNNDIADKLLSNIIDKTKSLSPKNLSGN